MPKRFARLKGPAVAAMVAWLAALLAVLGAAPVQASGVAARPANDDKPIAAMTRKKAGSGVTITHRVDGASAAGRPFTITLTFAGVVDPQGASVKVSADDGLQLGGNTTAALAPGTAASITLTAIAKADGVYFLNVFTKQGTLAGAISLPITVGAGQMTLEKPGQVKDAPAGERVLSLPAK